MMNDNLIFLGSSNKVPMNQQVKDVTVAKRPSFSDVENDNISSYEFVCGTCGCSVIQPVIKGLWIHQESSQASMKNWNCHHNCTKLIPVKYHHSDQKWTCSHEYRFVDGMTEAVKCIKCNDIIKKGCIGLYNHKGNYHCIPCNKDLKYLERHQKETHHHQLFEYNEVHEN